MMQQLQTQQSSALTAFARLVRSHAELTRELNARLVADHGLTIGDYEVLLRLGRAEDRRMRRVDLAGELVLSPSGVTRMLDRLQDAGWVEKGFCDSDARVTYAVLTDEGMSKLRAVSPAHAADVEGLLGERLDEAQLATLGELLERLGGAGDDACEPSS